MIIEEEGLEKSYDKLQNILSLLKTLKIKPDQEKVNEKFLRGFPPSWNNISLILRAKGGLEYLTLDDLFNKLRYLENDSRGRSSVPPSSLSNDAFLGSSRKLSSHESNSSSYLTTYDSYTASPESSNSKGSSK